jgi:hypothetical protein
MSGSYLDLLLQSSGNGGATIDGSPKSLTPASPKLPSKNRSGVASSS